jgi:N-acetylglucosaminyldiphosphoundecaprenol N-acetyl-beta-D-mannosaminyltransferase
MERVTLFGVTIDNVSAAEAVERVRELLEDGSQHYVTTPNTDHVVRLQKDTALRQAHAEASLVLADGWPVVQACRILGRPLKGRVTGADLLPNVCEMAAKSARSLYILGGMDGVAERAAHNLRARYPGLRIAGTYSPPFGFERDAEECRRIVERIDRARPDLLAIGLGCPKQELWIAKHRHEMQFGVALCIGAAIDFAAGNLSRAPQWMQHNGLEWLYRLAQEPGRLWKRYLVDDMAFARVVAREWFNRRKSA